MNINNDLNVQVIAKLGEGGFGQVYLVRNVKDKKLIAVKILEKISLCDSEWTVESMKRECKILIDLNGWGCPWFSKLLFSKNCRNALYFGLEFYNGGDLFHLQLKYGCFNEQISQFYITEIIFAIDKLHSLGIVHRDLKRENILLASSGHIVVADFGCSKEMEDNELSFTNVGTTGYIAPEVFLGKGYSFSCDIFAIGVIFVQLLTGQNPFIPLGCTLSSREKFNFYRQQTLLAQPRIPLSISKPAVDVALYMLEKNPAKRATYIDLKSMKFFQNILWTKVATQRISPPFLFNSNIINSSSQLDVVIKSYNGNITFNNFPIYHSPPTKTELLRIIENEHEIKENYEKKIRKLEEDRDDVIEKLKNLQIMENKQNIRNQEMCGMKQDYEKKISEFEKDRDDIINKLTMDYNQKIDKMLEDQKEKEKMTKSLAANGQLMPNQEIRKRPGPKLLDYDSNSKSKHVPCNFCGKGLSDRKALKKHIKAINNDKENYC